MQRWQQNEFLLKGLYLGLLVMVAWLIPTWVELAWVGLATAAGLASVSRAAIRLPSGEMGFGYVLGRDSQKAELIALCDALIQNDALAIAVEQKIVAPLRGELEAARAKRAAETAATRVDFYTLVRGEG